MKFTFSVLAIAALTFVAQLFLPWWSIAVVAFVVGFLIYQRRSFSAFAAGFVAIFMLWAIYAGVQDVQNESVLSHRIAELLQVQYSLLLILITGLIGGIVAGFAALTGNYLRKLI